MAASRSTLGILDRVQYEALRVALGCMNLTLVSIFYLRLMNLISVFGAPAGCSFYLAPYGLAG